MPKNSECALTVNASLDSLREVRDFLTTFGNKFNIDREVIADLHLAVDEAVTNIIMHGFAGRPGKIGINMIMDGPELLIRVTDDAPLFDPSVQRSPKLDSSPLDRAAAGGFGVELIRRVMDDVRYEVVDEHNQLILVKKVLI